MKDRLIKLLILAIIAAVLCAGFIYLDNIIVANAQERVCPYDYCIAVNGCYWADDRVSCEQSCANSCTIPYEAPYDPYPGPIPFDWCEWNECAPYPAPLPFAFPVWLQVILDSLASWL